MEAGSWILDEGVGEEGQGEGRVRGQMVVEARVRSVEPPFSQGKGKVLFQLYKDATYMPVRYGERIKIEAMLHRPHRWPNPTGFDYRQYLARKGIYAIVHVSAPSCVEKVGAGGGFFWLRWADGLRQKVEGIISTTLPFPHSEVLKGVTLGFKKAIPKAIYNAFTKTGIVHIVQSTHM